VQFTFDVNLARSEKGGGSNLEIRHFLTIGSV
jgi:hypothetical protein